MTGIERELWQALTALETAVNGMATAQPKPNLMPLFEQIETLADQLPRSTAPDLLHYLQKKSYQKARLWLEGRYPEIQTGGCQR
jgi:hypothetical protein